MRFDRRAATFAALLLVAFMGCARSADRALGRNGRDTEWRGYNGGYDATRFSPLTQINTKNVASLREVGRLKIPETLSFQCGPGVIGDTMYVTTAKSTYALDARTPRQEVVRTIETADQMVGKPR